MRETSHRTLSHVTTADTSSNGLSFRLEEPEAATGRKDMRVATTTFYYYFYFIFFFFVCVCVCPFSSSFSSFPLFYFYIYGLFAFGTTCLDRVIHTASKSEYFDSTLLLRKCQLQQCYPFVTFKPLPMKSFS